MNHGKQILKWYIKNQRPLPWRKKNPHSFIHPYKIWVAEVMLQQTTVKVVLPYYKKFLKKFPTLKSLASSSLEEVLSHWEGLGYYNRVRNLHKSAKLFLKRTQGKIPKTALELENYPGFGFYIARAVSSQAYEEPVSLLDGNVIRVLCRHQGLSIEWWKKKEQTKLIKIADQLRQNLPPGEFNQALMELGATICSPFSPSCSSCPLKKSCKAKKLCIINKIPLKKIRKKKEIWIWTPFVFFKNNKILLTNKHSCPFLKNQWILPSTIKQSKLKPKKYNFKHHITHHNIYIKLALTQTLRKKNQYEKWVPLQQISQFSPSSLLKKTLKEAAIL